MHTEPNLVQTCAITTCHSPRSVSRPSPLDIALRRNYRAPRARHTFRQKPLSDPVHFLPATGALLCEPCSMSSHSVSPLPSTDLPVGKEIDEHPRKRPRIERETNGAAHPSSRRKTACKVCSLRKVKCDAVRPSCSICRTNNAVCEYLDGPIEKLTYVSLMDAAARKT